MKEQKEKKIKPAKVPGALKKPIKKTIFEKRYLKYIEHPDDRSFFASCFEPKEETFVLREDIEKEQAKKLKQIFKVIKQNRKGGLSLIPLGFAAIVVTAIVVFFTIFANPLLGRALEMGLETLFEAKSDVRNFRLNVIRFRISISGITVANRDSPMKNLFEMGKTEIRLKPQAVLRGKVYIEEIRADTIRFGTERTVSGALPAKPPKVKETRPSSDEPPLIDLQNFDAMALLNREYAKLKTPQLYDEAITIYNETLAKWQGQVELVTTKTAELRTAAQPIININSSSLRDIETITKTVNDINTMITTVQTAADDATNIVSGIESDINTARNLEQNARNALPADIAHLKSFIDLGSGTAFAALEPSIRDILSDTAEQYLDYGLMALEVLERLKTQYEAMPKTEKAKKEPKVAFRGRDVNFPVRNYPAFFLGILASDFTLDAWNWAFDLRDISSNPDLTAKPVSLTLGLTEESGALQRQVAFRGNADFRNAPPDQQRFSAVVDGGGFPLDLGKQMGNVGISGFTGKTNFSVNLTGHTDGGVSGGGDVTIVDARLIDPQGTLAEALDTAVREASHLDLGIQYTHRIDKDDEFKITSNIVDLLTQALRRIAEAYAQKAMDEIERLLRQKIDEYIDGRFVSSEELDLLFSVARGDKAAMDSLRSSLTNKRTELEQQLKGAAEQAVQEVKEEVQRQAEQAVQGVLQGNQPSITVPSLPSISIPGR